MTLAFAPASFMACGGGGNVRGMCRCQTQGRQACQPWGSAPRTSATVPNTGRSK